MFLMSSVYQMQLPKPFDMKNISFLFALMLGLALQAQTDLNHAISLAQSGQHEAAEDLFETLAMQNSPDSAVLIHRAYNLSWWKKYDQAEKYFLEALKHNRRSPEIYTGLAYNNMWKGSYANATQYFNKALQFAPENTSAWVGLTQNFINQKNAEGARYGLNNVSNYMDKNAEYKLLEGQVLQLESENKAAKTAYKNSLSLDPNNAVAREKLHNYTSLPSKFSLTAWHGTTKTREGYSHALRRVEFTFLPNDKILLYGGYDNTLVLQNVLLRISEANAPYLFTGAKYGISKKWHSKFEVGYRLMDTRPDQKLYNLENIFFVTQKLLLISTVLFDDRKTEHLTTAGLTAEYALLPGFRLSGSYYHSFHLDMKDMSNKRIVLSPKFSYHQVELTCGIWYDQLLTGENNDQKITGGYGLLAFPIIDRLDGKILSQLDSGFDGEKSMLISGGLTIKL